MRVAAHAGIEPRLLVPGERRESRADYDGYRPTPGDILDLVDASGLRGRGGASFPTGRKLRAVAAGGLRPVVVANGEEGEPTSVKDRWLLRTRPHLVLDGLLHAATAVGADLAYVYVSDPDAERSVLDALGEIDSRMIDIRVVRVDPSYVAGEETAAVRAIDGGPAKPTDKPPRPFESGAAGRPTLVSNVETLANLPVLIRLGVDGYRSLGTDAAPGTFLLTLGGRVDAPGLYEVPLGTPLAAVIGGARPTGVLVGGYFGGLLNERAPALTLDYDTLALGCGAITVLGNQDCPVRVAAEVMAYFDRENAGQCGSCFNGTAAMAGTLAGLVAQTAGPDDLARLRRWSVQLVKRGACGTLDGAAALAASLLREFPAVVDAHLQAGCATCAAGTPLATGSPFAVEPPGARAELLGS